MADIIQHKRSNVSGNEPQAAELALGELAVNTADGHMFIERADATIACINGRRLVTKTANHTLVAGDHDAILVASTDAALDIRIPTHAVAPIRIGSVIPIIRRGSGLVEVFASSGVTLRAASGTILSEEFVPAYLMKIGTNEWVLHGSVDIAGNLSGILGYTLSANLLTHTMPPNMLLSRTSSAMCVGPDGLLRYAPENRVTRSQNFTTTWVASRIDTSASGLNASNLFTAPDGTTTANRLLADTSAQNHRVYQASLSSTGMAASRMTFSCHFKADTSNFAAIGIGNQNESRWTHQIVNVSTGALGSVINNGVTSPAIHSTSVQALGNGWYRVALCVSTTYTDANDDNYTVWLFVTTSSTSLSTAANSGAAVLIWGAQFQAGTILTDYVQTGATAYNGPLFDHSFTGEPRGLYIDQQVTNIARPAWAGFNCYNTAKPGGAGLETMVAATGIDGLSNSAIATTLTGGTAGSGFLDARVGEAASGNGVYALTAGTQYTLSFYWKSSRAFPSRIWNNTTGATITPDETVDEEGPNGFTRRRITYTVPAGATNIAHAWAYGSGFNSGDSFTLCAAQLETGPIASAFVPTRQVSVTRVADQVQYDVDGLGEWFTSNTYTMLIRYRLHQPAAFLGVAVDRYAAAFGSAAGGNTDPRVYINASYRVSSSSNAGRAPRVFDSSNTDLNAAMGLTATADANTGLVFAMSSNDSRIRYVGASATDTTSTPIDGLANFTRFAIGNNQAFGGADRCLRGHVQRLIYWPTRLTNAQMDGLVP